MDRCFRDRNAVAAESEKEFETVTPVSESVQVVYDVVLASPFR